MGELKWFIIGFIALYFIWLGTGGPARNKINRVNPFMDATYDGGDIYGIDELKQRQGR
jgi:hypothetical protein